MALDPKALIDERMVQIGIDPDGVIAAADAGFVWDMQRKYVGADWSDLRVVDLRAMRENRGDPEDVAAWSRGASTMGACLGDWMVNPRSTPEGLFAGHLFNGEIPKEKALGPVLRELSKIRECQWARTMLAGLLSPDFLDTDSGEGWSL